MKLNEYELDYVKYFVQTKGHYHYEILGEILDHFILLLEEKKEENPDTSFEKLVDDTYQTVGKLAFNAISRSAKERVEKKYQLIFFKSLFLFLNYRYILITAAAGYLLYHTYLLLDTSIYAAVVTGSTVLLLIFAYNYNSSITSTDPRFLCNKVASRYGFYLIFGAGLIFRILIYMVEEPIAYGLNLPYLILTFEIIAKVMIVYAIIKTGKAASEESESMEETYQVLK
jgi:hypothetical protein